jgi:hypothetical protein
VPIINFLNLFERNIGWLEDGWKSSFTILQRENVLQTQEGMGLLMVLQKKIQKIYFALMRRLA